MAQSPWYPQYDTWRRSPWSARKERAKDRKLDEFYKKFNALREEAGDLHLFRCYRAMLQATYDLECEAEILKRPRRFGPFFSEEYCQVCAIRLGLPRDYVDHCDRCGDKELRDDSLHMANRPLKMGSD